MSKKVKIIRPQRGITYECYRGFTDRMGARARRGRRYCFLSNSFTEYFFMFTISDRGLAVAVDKKKFAAHFIPVNPIEG